MLPLVFFLIVTAASKLAYVANLIRHGARYPLSNFYDGKETAQFHGVLTSVGMRQQFLLGGYLKADYINKLGLINQTLYPKEVEVFTDSSDRCVLSAISNLIGMFPFGTGETLPEGLDPEQLKPPYTPLTEDRLQRQEGESAAEFALRLGFQAVPYINATQFIAKCPNENNLIAKRIESLALELAEFQAIQAAFTEKMRITFSLEVTEANIAGLAELFDVVVCDLYLGRAMPSSFNDYDYKQLTYVHDYLFMLLYSGHLANVFSTPIVAAILHNMDNTVKNSQKEFKEVKKYSLYSGHDTNVAPMLSFFNLTSPQCITKKWRNETVSGNCAQAPPFASNLILQLHDNEGGNFTVKIRYNGEYFNVCGSTKECNYQEFAARCRAQFVDWRKECGVKTPHGMLETNNPHDMPSE